MKKLALIVCALMLLSMFMVACDNGTNNAADNAADNAKEEVEDTAEDVEYATDGNGAINEENDNDDDNGAAGDSAGDVSGDVDTDEGEELKGSAQGYGGEVTVTVRVDGDDIVSVEAVGEKETEGVGSKAIDQLPDKIEDADSTDVEVVSGATITSNAIKEAVNNALDK